jgi:hypothetical protein
MGAKTVEGPYGLTINFDFCRKCFRRDGLPGELYIDQTKGFLCYFPEIGLNLEDSVVEIPVLPPVICFLGIPADPVHHVSAQGFRIIHTSPFLEPFRCPRSGING